MLACMQMQATSPGLCLHVPRPVEVYLLCFAPRGSDPKGGVRVVFSGLRLVLVASYCRDDVVPGEVIG